MWSVRRLSNSAAVTPIILTCCLLGDVWAGGEAKPRGLGTIVWPIGAHGSGDGCGVAPVKCTPTASFLAATFCCCCCCCRIWQTAACCWRCKGMGITNCYAVSSLGSWHVCVLVGMLKNGGVVGKLDVANVPLVTAIEASKHCASVLSMSQLLCEMHEMIIRQVTDYAHIA